MYKCEFIGEAMKIKKLFFIILLIPMLINGQNINQLSSKLNAQSLELMSDEELRSYWVQAQEKGYTLDQVKTIARAQGASASEISELEKRIIKIDNF